MVGGWLISHFSRKRQKALAGSSEQILPKGVRLIRVKDFRKNPGVLSLGLELIGAVAIRLAQRYAKSWSAELLALIKGSPITPSESGSGAKMLAGAPSQAEGAPERASEAKRFPKGIVGLFKNTATEWLEDKCPQLGAALAYFTVFSLAPLVVVLLAVFGFIFGSSETARDTITEQLKYFIDPSGIKVIRDIAAQAAKPQAGVMAPSLG